MKLAARTVNASEGVAMGEALPTLKDWEELARKELKGREVSELDWHTAAVSYTHLTLPTNA